MIVKIILTAIVTMRKTEGNNATKANEQTG